MFKLLALLPIGILSACVTAPSRPTIINTGAELAPVVLTEKQKQPCSAPEVTLGADKLSLILQAEAEIEDCEYKRKTLVDAIEMRNSEIAKAQKDGFDKLNK